MKSRYHFSKEEIEAIERARKKNTNKRAEARLKALELRAKGMSSQEVSAATGFCAAYISQLVAKYRDSSFWLNPSSQSRNPATTSTLSVTQQAFPVTIKCPS